MSHSFLVGLNERCGFLPRRGTSPSRVSESQPSDRHLGDNRHGTPLWDIARTVVGVSPDHFLPGGLSLRWTSKVKDPLAPSPPVHLRGVCLVYVSPVSQTVACGSTGRVVRYSTPLSDKTQLSPSSRLCWFTLSIYSPSTKLCRPKGP